MIAYKSTGDEIVTLRAAFEHYDTEKDGYISFEEFRAALKDCRINDTTLNKLFNSIVSMPLSDGISVAIVLWSDCHLPFLCRTFLTTARSVTASFWLQF